jgi:dCMP deaminase
MKNPPLLASVDIGHRPAKRSKPLALLTDEPGRDSDTKQDHEPFCSSVTPRGDKHSVPVSSQKSVLCHCVSCLSPCGIEEAALATVTPVHVPTRINDCQTSQQATSSPALNGSSNALLDHFPNDSVGTKTISDNGANQETLRSIARPLRVSQKRATYLSWDDYFMGLVKLSALRSKYPGVSSRGTSPALASGACLVDVQNRVIGIGYNGFPANCSDDALPWTNLSSLTQCPPIDSETIGAIDTSTEYLSQSDRAWLQSSSPYVVRAEVNAILNKIRNDVTGCRLYTNSFPCHESAKVIIQSGIKEVIYWHNGDENEEAISNQVQDTLVSHRATRIMFGLAGVRTRRYVAPVSQRITTLLFGGAVGYQGPSDPQHSQTEGAVTSAAREAPVPEEHRKLLLREAGYDPMHFPTTGKRSSYLAWDDYFMAVAFLTAQRSKDPNTQVGACLVDHRRRIVGVGYNGFPIGCSDDLLPWARAAADPCDSVDSSVSPFPELQTKVRDRVNFVCFVIS